MAQDLIFFIAVIILSLLSYQTFSLPSPLNNPPPKLVIGIYHGLVWDTDKQVCFDF